MKKMKFSLGMKIVSLLSCVALVSMGFASWWILKLPETPTTSSGSFEVYTVNTKKVTIGDIQFKDSTVVKTTDPVTYYPSSKIIFGKAASDATSKWLIAGSDVLDQNLKAEFTFTVNLFDVDGNTETASESKVSDFLKEVQLDFICSKEVATALDNAINANYITAPKITYTYNTSVTNNTTYVNETTPNYTTDKTTTLAIPMNSATANTVTVTVTIEFGWGELFNSTDGTNLNPYVHYNSKSYTADLATEASTVLTALNALSAKNFSLKLTAVAP